jgi:hypothetical protein
MHRILAILTSFFLIFGTFVGQVPAQTSAYEVYYVKTMTDSKKSCRPPIPLMACQSKR